MRTKIANVLVATLVLMAVALNLVALMRRASGKLLANSNRLQKQVRARQQQQEQQRRWEEEGTLWVGSTM